jgi:DNA repair protein RadC
MKARKINDGVSIPVVTLKMVRESSSEYNSEMVSNKEDVARLARPFLENAAVERTVIIGLDIQRRPTVLHVSTGSIDHCANYPSTIFKILLLSNSHAFIMVHNHTGNSMLPSEADWSFTEKMKAGGKVLDVQIMDHVIVNANVTECVSMISFGRWSTL